MGRRVMLSDVRMIAEGKDNVSNQEDEPSAEERNMNTLSTTIQVRTPGKGVGRIQETNLDFYGKGEDCKTNKQTKQDF